MLARSLLESSFPLTNSHLGKSFDLESLRLKALLRAIIRFLEALYFSLQAFSHLMLFTSEK
jgi:hypothetical protein